MRDERYSHLQCGIRAAHARRGAAVGHRRNQTCEGCRCACVEGDSRLRFIRQGWSALRWAEEVVAIRDFIAGEDFTIFNDTVLALLEAVPELRGDPDLGATNEGVTIVWLK